MITSEFNANLEFDADNKLNSSLFHVNPAFAGCTIDGEITMVLSQSVSPEKLKKVVNRH